MTKHTAQARRILSEVAMSPAQLTKRDNWDVFIQKIEDKEPFELTPEAVELLGKDEVTLGYSADTMHQEFVEGMKATDMANVMDKLRNTRKTVLLPTLDGEKVRMSHLQKTKEFGRRGGKVETERQESALVNAINTAVAENGNKPITLETAKYKLENVTGANKVSGVNDYGKEPYADVAIHLKSGATKLISAKGTRAPSIAGGGIAGLMNVSKNIVGNAVKRAFKLYKEAYGDKEGMRFPPGKAIEVYVRIADKWVEPILRGTKEMGGPIDYMYVGPMDIDYDFEKKSGKLTAKLSGDLIDIDTYMEKIGNLYIRIRRRRKTQVLDFQSVDKYGFPNIFYQRGEGGRRFVLVSEKDVPKNLVKKGRDIWIGLGE